MTYPGFYAPYYFMFFEHCINAFDGCKDLEDSSISASSPGDRACCLDIGFQPHAACFLDSNAEIKLHTILSCY